MKHTQILTRPAFTAPLGDVRLLVVVSLGYETAPGQPG